MSRCSLTIHDSGQNYLCLACNGQEHCPVILLRILRRLVDDCCHIALENPHDKVVFLSDGQNIIHLPCFNELHGLAAICTGRDIEVLDVKITHLNPPTTDITIKYQDLASIWQIFSISDRVSGQSLIEYFRELADRAVAGL